MSNIDADPSQEEQQITIADYRAAMERAAKAERAADSANRIAALSVAGIPTGTPVGKAFAEKYDGKLDDPDAVRAAAVEWGLWKPEGAAASDANAPTPADQAQVDADRALLQHGGAAPNLAEEPPTKAPGKAGLDAFYERVQQRGDTIERASCEVTNRLVDAAIHGDPRAIVQPWTDEQLDRH